MRSESFGRLLKGAISSISHYESKTAPIVEDEIGQQIGVAGASIQRYKAGHLPPEMRTIEILAEAAVKRGLLGREWLERFLHAAQYPTPERLLNKLCPTGAVRQRPPRIYENLPAPTYSQFVMRQQAFAEVIDGLQQRSAVVLTVGLGGNGKTCLAREVAARCLTNDDTTPQFDAAVWVSDKDRPGTTNLSVVLDEIARTLDYPGFTQFEHNEKQREVEQLLRRQKVLLVVDNFETITDGTLLTWLLRLPEPSKALITSREYRREWRSSWPVELRGMTEVETRELIAERVRVLKIEKLVGDLSQLEPLLAATVGNPKAIELTMGLLKYERRMLQQIVDDLYSARGDLFDDLFSRAWTLLDESARRVLLVSTFFPASASSEALSSGADVQGFAFDRAIERLADLALLDVEQANLSSKIRYVLHPLVRAFACSKLKGLPEYERAARERWIKWYEQLADQVGYCWNDLNRLKLLDPERETIPTILEWASQGDLHDVTLHIAQKCSYYYYVRGLWNNRPDIHLVAAEAARKLGKPFTEAKELAYHVEWCSRKGHFDEAEKYLPKLQEVVIATDVPNDIYYEVQTAIAHYLFGQGKLDQAQQIWQELFDTMVDLPMRNRIGLQTWLARCFYEKGMATEARQAHVDALREAIKHNHMRLMISIQIDIAAIDLAQRNTRDATLLLNDVLANAQQYQDRRNLPEIMYLYAKLYQLQNELPAARASLAEAIDLFERLGMRRELAEAREELTRLEAVPDIP